MIYLQALKEDLITNFNYQEYLTLTSKKKSGGVIGKLRNAFNDSEKYKPLLIDLENDLKHRIKDVTGFKDLTTVFAGNISRCIRHQYELNANFMRSYIDYVILFLETAYNKSDKNSYDFCELADLIKKIKALPVKLVDDSARDPHYVSYHGCELKNSVEEFIINGYAKKKLNRYFRQPNRVMWNPGLLDMFNSTDENTMFKVTPYDAQYQCGGDVVFKHGFDSTRSDIVKRSVNLGIFALKKSATFADLPKEIKEQIISFVAEKDKSIHFSGK